MLHPNTILQWGLLCSNFGNILSPFPSINGYYLVEWVKIFKSRESTMIFLPSKGSNRSLGLGTSAFNNEFKICKALYFHVCNGGIERLIDHFLCKIFDQTLLFLRLTTVELPSSETASPGGAGETENSEKGFKNNKRRKWNKQKKKRFVY